MGAVVKFVHAAVDLCGEISKSRVASQLKMPSTTDVSATATEAVVRASTSWQKRFVAWHSIFLLFRVRACKQGCASSLASLLGPSTASNCQKCQLTTGQSIFQVNNHYVAPLSDCITCYHSCHFNFDLTGFSFGST